MRERERERARVLIDSGYPQSQFVPYSHPSFLPFPAVAVLDGRRIALPQSGACLLVHIRPAPPDIAIRCRPPQLPIASNPSIPSHPSHPIPHTPPPRKGQVRGYPSAITGLSSAHIARHRYSTHHVSPLPLNRLLRTIQLYSTGLPTQQQRSHGGGQEAGADSPGAVVVTGRAPSLPPPRVSRRIALTSQLRLGSTASQPNRR